MRNCWKNWRIFYNSFILYLTYLFALWNWNTKVFLSNADHSSFLLYEKNRKQTHAVLRRFLNRWDHIYRRRETERCRSERKIRKLMKISLLCRSFRTWMERRSTKFIDFESTLRFRSFRHRRQVLIYLTCINEEVTTASFLFVDLIRFGRKW